MAEGERVAGGGGESVYYFCYGSNVSEERFRCYVFGGKTEKMKTACRGFRKELRQMPGSGPMVRVGAELLFGRRSSRWSDGGVAFLNFEEPKVRVIEEGDDFGWVEDKRQTVGKLWKMSVEQFADLVAQENQKRDTVGKFAIPGAGEGVDVLKLGWYRHVLCIGKYDGLPVLTFTSPPAAIDKMERNAPHPDYSSTICEGLVASCPPGLDKDEWERKVTSYMSKRAKCKL